MQIVVRLFTLLFQIKVASLFALDQRRAPNDIPIAIIPYLF